MLPLPLIFNLNSMPELTLNGIENLLNSKLEPINARLEKIDTRLETKVETIETKISAIEETVSSHTATLDAIAKYTKVLDTELPALRVRLERMEDWIKQAAPKLGLDYKV